MLSLKQIVLLSCGIAAAAVRADEEFIMPRMQINTYLSHAKPPGHFGLQAVNGADSLTYSGTATIPPRPPTTLSLANAPLPVIRSGSSLESPAVTALIDTSSPVSWMEFATAMKLSAVFLAENGESMRYSGPYNTGDAPAYAAVIPDLQLNTLPISNTPLYVRMAMYSLGPLARGIKNPEIDCVFGYDLLSNFEYIRFDFQRDEIIFSSSTPYAPNQDLLMTATRITSVKGFGLAVEGGIQGTPTPIILDVAGSYHFSRGDIKVKVTKQVSIGELVYRNVPTLLLPTHQGPPRAGRNMLENYIVTICPKKSTVYFERYPEQVQTSVITHQNDGAAFENGLNDEGPISDTL